MARRNWSARPCSKITDEMKFSQETCKVLVVHSRILPTPSTSTQRFSASLQRETLGGELWVAVALFLELEVALDQVTLAARLKFDFDVRRFAAVVDQLRQLRAPRARSNSAKVIASKTELLPLPLAPCISHKPDSRKSSSIGKIAPFTSRP